MIHLDATHDPVLRSRVRSANAEDVRRLLVPLAAGDLNAFMALGPSAPRTLRQALSQALGEGAAAQAALAGCLVPQSGVELGVPCRIGDYADFYVGIHHATAVGPTVGPSQRLDIEPEVGMRVGRGHELGEPIAIGAAEDHLFGITLFNDWSARDIQAWE